MFKYQLNINAYIIEPITRTVTRYMQCNAIIINIVYEILGNRVRLNISPSKNKYTGNYYTYYCVIRDTKVAVIHNKNMSLHCNILMLKRNEKNEITPWRFITITILLCRIRAAYGSTPVQHGIIFLFARWLSLRKSQLARIVQILYFPESLNAIHYIIKACPESNYVRRELIFRMHNLRITVLSRTISVTRGMSL